MTLNGVMAIILRYFTQLGSFRGQLRISGWLAVNRFSYEICHKVHQLSTTDAVAELLVSHSFREQRLFYLSVVGQKIKGSPKLTSQCMPVIDLSQFPFNSTAKNSTQNAPKRPLSNSPLPRLLSQCGGDAPSLPSGSLIDGAYRALDSIPALSARLRRLGRQRLHSPPIHTFWMRPAICRLLSSIPTITIYYVSFSPKDDTIMWSHSHTPVLPAVVDTSYKVDISRSKLNHKNHKYKECCRQHLFCDI